MQETQGARNDRPAVRAGPKGGGASRGRAADELDDVGSGTARRLLAAIGAACVVLNPDAIVVDGTLKDAVKPVIDGIRHGIERHAPSVAADSLAVLPVAVQDNAGIYGALALSSEAP